jgi:long-chain acyl-CoA synthetase
MVDEQLKSVIEYFYESESTTPDKIFLRQPKGDQWIELTYKEAGIEARKVAAYLRDIGLGEGDHIAIYSKNCYHWILSDLAIMMIGAVSVPLYASLSKSGLKEVLELSDSKAIFVGKLDAFGERKEAISSDMKVIRYPQYAGNATVDVGEKWEDIIAKYEPVTDNYAPDLDDLWTIKFTSGTTGTPKGVMHIHRTPSLIMENERKTGWIGIYNMKDHRYFSFLPLNHVGERLGMEVPAICTNGTISFAESLDTFAKNIQETQPTMLFAVPRIWTKFYLGVLAKMPQKKLDTLFKIPIVSGIIKKKIRTGLGLRDAKVVATGAAITPKYLKDWYKKLGLHLIEAYGMTEVCGSMTNGVEKDAPADSVGSAIPHGEVKIDDETGEILMKTPYIMTGYYKDPEKTAEVLKDGWMHSGDKGTIDEKGYVRVIGRVKDAFKTSKGSFITPNPMEEVIAKNDYVEQCCVVGLGIPQPMAMINLSEIGQSADKTTVEESFRNDIQALNKTLESYKRISTVVIDQNTWSIENELITPTLKVKRPKLDERYGKDYLNWHEAKEDVMWV